MLRGEHPARRQREEPAGESYYLFKGLINMAKAVEELAEDIEKIRRAARGVERR
jgi:hypothetical protein